MRLKEIIEDSKKDQEKKYVTYRNITTYKINYNDFMDLLELKANDILLKRGEKTRFLVDKENNEFIKNLYLYFVGSKECEWDIHKGILAVGNFGSGKTLLMLAFVGVYNFMASLYRGKVVKITDPEGIEKNKMHLEEKYIKIPLYINDIGKEEKIVNDFGTKKAPMAKVLDMRCEAGGMTFGTANFSISDLKDMYGTYLEERFIAMFNIVVLKTKKSRRRK